MKQLAMIAITATLFLAGCSKEPPSNDSSEDPKISVTSMQAEPASINKSIRVLGSIKAIDSVALYSKVSGKLVDYTTKTGSEVKKGDLIAFVDRDEVGYKYNQAPLYSPIEGIISSLPLNQGCEVRLDTPVAFIVNIDTVNAVYSLPENYRSTVKVGQKIEIQVDNNRIVAEVSEIDPLIDPVAHAFTFKALLNNPDKELIPGMFASGDLIVATHENSIMLPEEAIVALQGEWYVYKIVSEQALLKKVKLGLRKEGKVQILEGVEPKELVIVGGNHKVSDGQKVKNKII